MPRTDRVEITERARRDVDRIYEYIAADNVRAAERWRRTFGRHARSLAENPLRFEALPEADATTVPLRHLIFGNYRIIYLVEEGCVTIIRVFHAARTLRPEHLDIE